MKKIIAGTLAVFLLTTVYGQTPGDNSLAAATPGYAAAWPLHRTFFPVGITTKAVRNFYERYGDDNNESWYATTSGFRAKFQQNGIAFMSDYSTRGEWLLTIKTYAENKLPKDTRERIKRVYYDQQISLVQEIDRHNETVYYVNIENDRSWTKLRLLGDEMEILAVYTK